jgi:hypothetical protein
MLGGYASHAAASCFFARRHTYVVQCDGDSNDDTSGWGCKGRSKGGNTLGLHTAQHSTAQHIRMQHYTALSMRPQEFASNMELQHSFTNLIEQFLHMHTHSNNWYRWFNVEKQYFPPTHQVVKANCQSSEHPHTLQINTVAVSCKQLQQVTLRLLLLHTHSTSTLTQLTPGAAAAAATAAVLLIFACG